jgi:hypothetical protein
MIDETRAPAQVLPPGGRPTRGVRVAELGRPPIEINLGPDERMSVADLISRGHISSDASSQIYVNMRPVSDNNQEVHNGDTVVTVRKIVAG